MKSLYITLLIVFIAGVYNVSGQSLIITPNNSPTQLVQNGLIGPGVNVTNIGGVVGSGATFTNNGITNFPFASGLILTTGTLNNYNSTSSTFLSGSLGMAGDPLLDAIVAPQLTYDAQVLTFDFASAADSMEFDFIFSSEEYNEYVNTPFNDVFGFFITGPGFAPNTNVALIPGTTTPIAINSVNNGGPYGGAASGPCSNCAYYLDNAGSTVYPLAPDGFTVGINIRFAVQPCATYSFKIALADVSDGVFDSQVMMNLGSFTPCSTPRIMAAGVTVFNPQPIQICYGDSIELSLPDAPNYNWSTGQTTQSIYVSQSGSYSAFMTSGNCIASAPVVEVIVADSIPAPAISLVNDTLFSGYNYPGYTFSWTLDGQPVAGAGQNQLAASANGCYTLVVTNAQGCSLSSNTYCVGTTGIGEHDAKQVSIVPNPVNGTSTIFTGFKSGTPTTLIITDNSGKVVFRQIFTTPSIEWSKGDLSNGVYFMELYNSSSSKVFREKIVVAD